MTGTGIPGLQPGEEVKLHPVRVTDDHSAWFAAEQRMIVTFASGGVHLSAPPS